jgi:small basic protein
MKTCFEYALFICLSSIIFTALFFLTNHIPLPAYLAYVSAYGYRLFFDVSILSTVITVAFRLFHLLGAGR